MKRHPLRRLLKGLLLTVAALVAVIGLSAAIAVGGIELACAPTGEEDVVTASLDIDEPGYRRAAANTYLTFPEWYIVYAFEDFGRYLDKRSESGFPYVSQIAGFWRSYCAANRQALAYPGDHFEYKLMINVIGLSYSFEFALKGAYEKTVGWLTERLRGPEPTAEDVFAREVVQDYARFLHEIPWYRYPFMAKLRDLWATTPIVGPSPVRSIERKASLSAEYLVKAGYARLIAAGLSATFAPADLEIMFVVRGDPAPLLADEPELRLVRRLPDDMALLVAPRYQRFTELALRLARRGVAFVEIAGNRRILMSAIVPDGLLPAIPGARQLFLLPVDGAPGMQRAGFDLDVGQLSAILTAYEAAGIGIEHLYDY